MVNFILHQTPLEEIVAPSHDPIVLTKATVPPGLRSR